MRKNKVLSGVLAVLMVFSLVGGLSATAAYEPAELANLDLESISASDVALIKAASTYAYLDLETAPAQLEANILAAREDIIYHQSWSIDGGAYIVYEDGTREQLPLFYDLFPEDWDMPTDEFDVPNLDISYAASNSSSWKQVFGGYVNVPRNANTSNAAPFCWYVSTMKGFTMEADTFSAGITSVNLGFSDGNGNTVAYAMNVPTTLAYFEYANTIIGQTYGARISTDSPVSGTAYACVYDGYNEIILW